MALNLILNSSNVIGTNKTTYRFSFSNGSYTINPDSEICIATIQMPFSFFNVNSGLYNNNKIQYIWNTATPQTFTLTLTNGYYNVSDIQNALEQSMIQNGCYLYNSTTGNNYYFIQIISNATYYANQIILFPPPISLGTVSSGYSVPSNWAGYAATGPDGTGYTPQVQFPSSGSVNQILGFTAGAKYPPSLNDKSSNYLSTITPNLATINSIIVQCSLVNNKASFPSTILDSFPIGDTSFGYNINYLPTYEKWIQVMGGTYQFLDIVFTDQNFGQIQANDSNVLISLLLKQGKRTFFEKNLIEKTAEQPKSKIYVKPPSFRNDSEEGKDE
jgi:hypothetical protein